MCLILGNFSKVLNLISMETDQCAAYMEYAETKFMYFREMKKEIRDKVEKCENEVVELLSSLEYIMIFLSLLSNTFYLMLQIHLDCKAVWVSCGFIVAYIISLAFPISLAFLKMKRIITYLEVLESQELLYDGLIWNLHLQVWYREPRDRASTDSNDDRNMVFSDRIILYMEVMGSIDAGKNKWDYYFSLFVIVGFTILYALSFGILLYVKFCASAQGMSVDVRGVGVQFPS